MGSDDVRRNSRPVRSMRAILYPCLGEHRTISLHQRKEALDVDKELSGATGDLMVRRGAVRDK